MGILLENLKSVYEQKIQKESFLKKHAGKIAAGAGAIVGGKIGRNKDVYNVNSIKESNKFNRRNLEDFSEYVKQLQAPGSKATANEIKSAVRNLEDNKENLATHVVGIADKYGKTAAGAALGGLAAYGAYKGGKALYNRFKKK